MVEALEHLRALEREVIRAVNQRAQMNVVGKVCRSDTGKRLIESQIYLISTRIVRAQMEIFAIEGAYFAEIQQALRDEKYPPIPAHQKSVIRYADESTPTEMAARK